LQLHSSRKPEKQNALYVLNFMFAKVELMICMLTKDFPLYNFDILIL
jgi:hypothetical protein